MSYEIDLDPYLSCFQSDLYRFFSDCRQGNTTLFATDCYSIVLKGPSKIMMSYEIDLDPYLSCLQSDLYQIFSDCRQGNTTLFATDRYSIVLKGPS